MENPQEQDGKSTSTDESASGTVNASAGGPTNDVVSEWKSKVLYLSAEMENMRKRFSREKSEVVKFANEELLKALLPVVDNLYLAVQAAKSGTANQQESADHPLVKNLVTGFEMTVRHLEQTFEQLGLKTIEASGQAFDPALHEALGQDNSSEADDGAVTQVLQRGYVLHGRVIRSAKVIVNRKPPQA